MRKFKLIKEYPNSPKLGTISSMILSDSIESYPEYWEEIKEKEYEIISFISYSKIIYYLQKSGKFYATGTLMEKEVSLGEIINTEGYEIYSVKRLSDGEVFTIGDKVGINRPWIIKEFTFVNFRTTEDILSACDEKGGTYISQLVKFVGKQPLFKTEDGIDIFKGDSYYPITEEFVICNKCTYPTGNKMFKLFSTKKAAEEYILMNKHCLSIKDVLHNVPNNAAYDFMKHRLQELVKQKLK